MEGVLNPLNSRSFFSLLRSRMKVTFSFWNGSGNGLPATSSMSVTITLLSLMLLFALLFALALALALISLFIFWNLTIFVFVSSFQNLQLFKLRKLLGYCIVHVEIILQTIWYETSYKILYRISSRAQKLKTRRSRKKRKFKTKKNLRNGIVSQAHPKRMVSNV